MTRTGSDRLLAPLLSVALARRGVWRGAGQRVPHNAIGRRRDAAYAEIADEEVHAGDLAVGVGGVGDHGDIRGTGEGVPALFPPRRLLAKKLTRTTWPSLSDTSAVTVMSAGPATTVPFIGVMI